MLNIDAELDRQREVLLKHELPHLVGLTEDAFTDAVEALRPAVRDAVSGKQSRGRASFVLVVSGGTVRDMVAAQQQVPLLRLAGPSTTSNGCSLGPRPPRDHADESEPVR